MNPFPHSASDDARPTPAVVREPNGRPTLVHPVHPRWAGTDADRRQWAEAVAGPLGFDPDTVDRVLAAWATTPVPAGSAGPEANGGLNIDADTATAVLRLHAVAAAAGVHPIIVLRVHDLTRSVAEAQGAALAPVAEVLAERDRADAGRRDPAGLPAGATARIDAATARMAASNARTAELVTSGVARLAPAVATIAAMPAARSSAAGPELAALWERLADDAERLAATASDIDRWLASALAVTC